MSQVSKNNQKPIKYQVQSIFFTANISIWFK